MGMFDEFIHPCSKCGEDIVWQSKAGPCILHINRIGSCDDTVAADLNGEISQCHNCGNVMKIISQVIINVVDEK